MTFEHLDRSSSNDRLSTMLHDQGYHSLSVLLILRFVTDRLVNDQVCRHLNLPLVYAFGRRFKPASMNWRIAFSDAN